MKKLTNFKLITILLIGSALLLICHVHPHHSWWDSEDDHCFLCQILQAGVVYVSPFVLSLLFILIALILQNQTGVLTTSTPTGYANRAPPTALF